MASETRAPTVSVIISTYNRKKLLKQAIKSVLAQSYPDLECIVVDDCSTEDVETMVRSFGDPRLKYLRTEKNSGHDGLPKNMGIAAAHGEYICFLDDDDVYRRDALKILLTYIRETGVDVVYGDYLIDGRPGWSLDFSTSKLSEFNYIAMCSTLLKREAVLAVGGFDEAVPKFKDWNLWLRLQKNGARFMHIPIVVFEIHETPGSISTTVAEEKDEFGRYKPTYFNPADCLIYPERTSLGQKSAPRVAVYTLTMDRLDYTKQAMKALDRLADYPFDWFVIDQGSTDGTQKWVGEQMRRGPHGFSNIQKINFRPYAQNVGLAKGWNNMLDWIKSEGGYDIVVKVDNDAEMLSQGWLKAMVEIFKRNRKVVLSPYVEGLEHTPGGVLRERQSGDSPYLMINDTVLGLVPHLGGIVMAHPIELVKDWRFDELAAGNKDIMLSKYARERGFALFYMEEYRVWHIDGTIGQHKKYPDYFLDRQAERKKLEVEEDARIMAEPEPSV